MLSQARQTLVEKYDLHMVCMPQPLAMVQALQKGNPHYHQTMPPAARGSSHHGHRLDLHPHRLADVQGQIRPGFLGDARQHRPRPHAQTHQDL